PGASVVVVVEVVVVVDGAVVVEGAVVVVVLDDVLVGRVRVGAGGAGVRADVLVVVAAAGRAAPLPVGVAWWCATERLGVAGGGRPGRGARGAARVRGLGPPRGRVVVGVERAPVARARRERRAAAHGYPLVRVGGRHGDARGLAELRLRVGVDGALDARARRR